MKITGKRLISSTIAMSFSAFQAIQVGMEELLIILSPLLIIFFHTRYYNRYEKPMVIYS